MVAEVLNESSLVIPSVTSFQDKQPEEGVHLIACRTLIPVMGTEPEVG